LNISEIRTGSEIASIATLADEIWHEHFTPIIGTAQVEYMLEKFQSPDAIRQQINSGHIYMAVQMDGDLIGYAGLIPDIKNRSIQLSKFYILKSFRRHGIGRELMRHIERLCLEKQIDRIWLTVNRHNSDSIAAYFKMGFSKTGETVSDIGNGFVMDDFMMEKRLTSEP